MCGDFAEALLSSLRLVPENELVLLEWKGVRVDELKVARQVLGVKMDHKAVRRLAVVCLMRIAQ